jgi:hypothetical protein
MKNRRKQKKILICVEGAKTEVRLMERLLNIYGIDADCEIVSYRTNIYALHKAMFRDSDPENMGLLLTLKEHEPDAEKKKIFDDAYTDILLIFDMDPQDDLFAGEKLLEMTSYFSESSDNGKLYINYPSAEAFYHMRAIPDAEYYERFATLSEMKAHTYKARVNAESKGSDHRKFASDRTSCNAVIGQNIEKARRITQSAESGENIFNMVPLLNKQLDFLNREQKIWVLCTCAFFIAEYNPELII